MRSQRLSLNCALTLPPLCTEERKNWLCRTSKLWMCVEYTNAVTLPAVKRGRSLPCYPVAARNLRACVMPSNLSACVVNAGVGRLFVSASAQLDFPGMDSGRTLMRATMSREYAWRLFKCCVPVALKLNMFFTFASLSSHRHVAATWVWPAASK